MNLAFWCGSIEPVDPLLVSEGDGVKVFLTIASSKLTDEARGLFKYDPAASIKIFLKNDAAKANFQIGKLYNVTIESANP